MDSDSPLRITSRQRFIAILALAALVFGLGYAKAQMHDSWVVEKADARQSASQSYVAEMPPDVEIRRTR
ncbi:MAG TPA: hypothetical protein VFS04_07085 [Alphaproteobacteria bacterium]|nr:hypothetical protein [Alphaproteobacteria bacterium]